MPKSPFLLEAQARGLIFQCTDLDALDAAMQAGPITAYVGFDPTADSLHVGNAMSIMALRLLQKHGHRPIALMGGGTAKIGDPSFRDEARSLMTNETITHNIAGIEQSLRQFITFSDEDPSSGAILANNAEWLDKLSYINLLQDVGVHFSISRMLSFESVKQRLDREQGLTFLEFNYSILQSYDFRELNRRHGAVLQMGGSDQWGNIVAGIDLTRRTDGKQVFGLTTPLVTTSSGVKMGKSAQGATWLRAEKRSVFDYWQFWRNTEDADVGRFLKLFTDLPVEECERLGALEGAEINEAKKILATEATAICHGRTAAEEAADTARKVFEQGSTTAALPEIDLPANMLAEGLPAFRVFQEAGLAASGGEARRLIRGGGGRVNDAVVSDENQLFTLSDLRDGTLKVSSGKKKHILIRPV
ncbi:tyrosyl-tRNA synthetase [Gluconobacter thailandicus F149-1 = NBRC 100600]|uniref:Tyrosine--tRNA ligase n=1 Tax=Gluconobacter thailandicus NBRC 3257 TaxID=1381097 RepID=A0ABQ0IUN3_GLUTH|nr:tyrosine--tRNA ligase [Gluconobacter thailandicus]KXV53774.1 tyrosyl-tRNA synthetase [Gluconobacter thailandicus]GAC86368.1 tyrosyl-tRNA synthetase [Gluconobacter thailandicus NBRC 3255]GAD25929.1 tyrosyl-tRNA synthetase [Gluconobacter thailandicus NBRC 3257]GAN94128.1 tyrosyl-tRNA synthetase [Gluconobacter thailandicus F149-1 = NBRC 100600]GBR58752.1 tyrosyl-tRNA synthetase [Gluconobacter thailandicus F149-1 = NBRC 100600]